MKNCQWLSVALSAQSLALLRDTRNHNKDVDAFAVFAIGQWYRQRMVYGEREWVDSGVHTHTYISYFAIYIHILIIGSQWWCAASIEVVFLAFNHSLLFPQNIDTTSGKMFLFLFSFRIHTSWCDGGWCDCSRVMAWWRTCNLQRIHDQNDNHSVVP